jgi:hypothetical protein
MCIGIYRNFILYSCFKPKDILGKRKFNDLTNDDAHIYIDTKKG